MHILNKENQINKVLKLQKEKKEDIKILFVSPWCDYCNNLLEDLELSLPLSGDERQSLYVVNSFQMPHSFVIFKVRKTPCLITLKGNRVKKEDYLSMIYTELEL